MERLTVKIAVERTSYHFDKAYEYLLPDALAQQAAVGCRVLVPFGGGNRTKQGVILQLQISGNDVSRLKPVLAVLDTAPLLSEEMLQLAVWMKERYFCTMFEAIHMMLPAGIQYKTEVSYMLPPEISPDQREALSSECRQIIEYLAAKRQPVPRSKLLNAFDLSQSSTLLEELAQQGVLMREDGAFRRMGDAAIRMVRLSNVTLDTGILGKLTPKQKEVYSLVQSAGGASVKEICYYTGITAAVVNALVKKGVLEYYHQEVYRTPGGQEQKPLKRQEEVKLTAQQQQAYERILAQYRLGQGGVSLLFGVTGSGKTSVFMKLIEKVSEEGRGVIVMVPEISLTPQMIEIFRKKFGDQVAVFHSALSMGERMDEWKRVKQKKATIVVGTRSAVFAPFEDVGLIIMDEEQEYTYKSENAPRFHAREIAKFRCHFHKGLLVLSSATPAIESYYAASKGIYSINRLTERYGNAQLPKVIIADMNQEQEEGNLSTFSSVLLECLRENLRMGRQSILLLNRRGYHTFVSCRACMEVLTCPNCSISLTYHAANHRLMCHYCGYSTEFTEECPACHQRQLRFSGMGTQRAVQELETYLSDARILRMDTDTTMTKDAHEKKLAQFAQGNYDIMVGTQMVAKGLDFPNVTLVGVLSADQALYSDDFRSYERAFSLLTQVVGRSGRGKQAGLAIIQTYTPENPIIQLAAAQDYEAFYQSEIAMRRAMLYPPFADLCVVGFIGSAEIKTSRAARWFFQQLTRLAQTDYQELPLRVLGPSCASIAKVSNKYRYRIIIKYRNCKRFREMISLLLKSFGRQRGFSDVTVFADVNPDVIL